MRFTGDDINDASIKKLIKWAIRTFTTLAVIITLFGLILAACLKIEKVSTKILPLFPRYILAMQAIKILENDPQPMKKGDDLIKHKDSDQPVMATVLSIDDPSWPVMLDFIKSEIAFRKSDRNEPIEEYLSSEGQPSDNSNTPHKILLAEINYDRIKAIFVIRVRNVPKTGNKPLVEPYRAFVIEPSQKKYRRVYDFLSFQEFKPDIKKMLVGELEFYSILLAIIAFLCNIALYFIKKYLTVYLKDDKISTETP